MEPLRQMHFSLCYRQGILPWIGTPIKNAFTAMLFIPNPYLCTLFDNLMVLCPLLSEHMFYLNLYFSIWKLLIPFPYLKTYL